MTETMPGDVLDTGAAGGKAIRGGATRTAGYGLSLLMSLAAVPFMIRHLGAVDYGYYVTVSSIIFILGGVTEAGLTNLAIREYSVLAPTERTDFLRNVVGLRFALTALGGLLATAIVAVTGARGVIVQGVAISALALLISLTQQTYMVPLTAHLRLGWVTGLDLLRQGTLNGFVIGLVIVGAGLVPFFWASVAAAVVMVVATVALVRREADLRPAFDMAVWRSVAREVIPYALAAAVGLIYFRIAVILMSYVSTPEETGYFSAAFRIAEVVAVTPWILVTAGFPILARAARDDEERLGYALQRLFEVSTGLGAWIAICIGVGAPFAVDVVAGPGFGESVGVLRVQGIGLLTAFLVATWLFGLLSMKLFRPLLIVNAVAALVSVVGTLVLAGTLGAEGAAASTVAAEFYLAIGCYLAVRKARPGIRPSLGVIPKVALASAVAIAPALVLDVHPVILVAIATVLYFAVLVPLRGVPPELLNALRGRDPEPIAPREPR
jgi:O-antigen/teichoic acid export membrane protein